MRVGDDQVQIDPELLFQGLIILPKSAEEKEQMFCFELCPHPPSLFDETLMLREAHKSMRGDAIWSKLEPGTIESIGKVQYVLDGEVCFTIYMYHGHVVHQHIKRYARCTVPKLQESTDRPS